MPLFSGTLRIFEKVIYRIEDIIRPSSALPPDDERMAVVLPPDGETTSVEMALNSRCSSDYDGNPRKFHWGMFDVTKKLSDKQIARVVSLSRIPRFTDERVEIQSSRSLLTFIVENKVPEIIKNHMMVESGMQQQSVGLACSALGVGNAIKNLGKDGTRISCDDYATVKMKLDAMKPTYNGSFWSDLAPAGRVSWLRGNLPDPSRDGKTKLLAALASVRMKDEGPGTITEKTVSQLLWAARGRTPHLYKSKPWGLTIPTWGGEQDISSVYLISDCKLFKYVNWHKNKPTHSLIELNKISADLMYKLEKLFPSYENVIVLGRNENFHRALWEVGYQMLNILLQAKALDVPYEAVFLEESQKKSLKTIGVNGPVAIVKL